MMKLINQLKYLVPIIVAVIVLFTCNRKAHHPGLEYAPDMFHSKAYETYTYSERSVDGKGKGDIEKKVMKERVAMTPVEGTIPVNHDPYHMPNTTEGYNEATTKDENPIELTDAVLARGKQVYSIHCAPCHGAKGDGQGTAVVGSEYRLPPPPISFIAPTGNWTAGRIFHVITYGKGNMGSYASQVNTEDRWNLVHYVQSLNESNQTEETAAEDDAATNEEG